MTGHIFIPWMNLGDDILWKIRYCTKNDCLQFANDGPLSAASEIYDDDDIVPPSTAAVNCDTVPVSSDDNAVRISDDVNVSDADVLDSVSEEHIEVLTTNNEQRRIRDKKYRCLYCEMEVAQLPRHLYSSHADQIGVQELQATKDPRKKRRLLAKLRHVGNHQQNLDTLKQGKGHMRVVYRPRKGSSVLRDSSKYVPCEYCCGYYCRKQLWRHVRRCPVATASNANCRQKDKKMKPARAADQFLVNSSADGVATVISNMRKGKVFSAIRNDSLAHELARKLMSRAGHSVHHVNYVRARLRKLGRLLLQIRKDNVSLRSASLSTIIAPEHFQTVISAVKVVAGYDAQSHKYKAPSLGVHLGHDLRKCGLTLKSSALQANDLTTMWKADAFVKLCTDEWNYEIAGGARRELQTQKFNRPNLLPLTSDVVKLTTYLKDTVAENLSVVKSSEDDVRFSAAFRTLSDAVLSQLILFNRRRQGEVSKVTMECYNNHACKVTHCEDIKNSLSPLEQHLCSLYTRVEIPGKRNNCVPVLMTDDQTHALSFIVNREYRQRAGIHDCNTFVFAMGKGSLSHTRGHDVLRRFSGCCDAENPENLRSSRLRKHIATLSQILNLRKNELDQLAQFMGHDVRVHRESYRLPNDILQTAQVVKVLMAMENGSIGDYRGKNLTDIDVSNDIGETLCLYVHTGTLID